MATRGFQLKLGAEFFFTKFIWAENVFLLAATVRRSALNTLVLVVPATLTSTPTQTKYHTTM